MFEKLSHCYSIFHWLTNINWLLVSALFEGKNLIMEVSFPFYGQEGTIVAFWICLYILETKKKLVKYPKKRHLLCWDESLIPLRPFLYILTDTGNS